MIQWILAIWPLALLPFLNPACTSGSSQFTYCRSLAWMILHITLLPCETNAIVLMSPANKVMLKTLQAKLQQHTNQEFPDVQAGFRKGRGSRDQTASIWCIIEKAKQFQRNIYFCFTDYAKAFDCVDHNKLWKILNDMEIPEHLTSSCMQVKKQQLEPEKEKITGWKLGKEYIKTVYCHLAYLTSMPSTYVKCWAGWITCWNQDCQEKYQQPQISLLW